MDSLEGIRLNCQEQELQRQQYSFPSLILNQFWNKSVVIFFIKDILYFHERCSRIPRKMSDISKDIQDFLERYPFMKVIQCFQERYPIFSIKISDISKKNIQYFHEINQVFSWKISNIFEKISNIFKKLNKYFQKV